MADQEAAKTRTIGYLPIEKVRNLSGWNEYLDKSTKLSALRTETQKAKNLVRDDLKQRLSEKGEIDFVAEGDRVRVIQVFRGAVAGLVGIEDGVVSGVINLESSGVEAPDWRPRHDKQYHEA